ncbi:solute carrier family 13 (sodium-dependent dicarboxylate transporter), member 2/3/5 [Candidatus Frackibacter sp. WG12]|uniref:SLC13 family permease n=1 Tax=unclassified Candidatus Frackibacter TaxID=2648818 RepID=UPI000795F34C|nr:MULTISPECIES: DASS family sodium-coupled anion symporter [unclassified Candidatus Frackibacter]KXS43446.1 MAG: anion transporter [Candidatus Frackibacter sp. T328-2]SDC57316.1 solute carrier family 13 (sodium-dependent dicarboxylate transporter), member 2/3/5 [Candidatus Frackibacter sp. WG11]SEM71426.1 solute carrier family 13 (sodium-dependent dicarboxylate transporter), member 2/3/5 [Candidatus Frackibacter sp. WG12]
MSSIADKLKTFWDYLWHLNKQTKSLLKMDTSAMMAAVSESDAADQQEAEELLDKQSNNGGDGGDDQSPFDVDENYGMRQKVGLVLGPLFFLVIMMLPTPEGLSPEGQAVAGVAAWMASWWISEAIPIPATSLLPLVLFPFAGVMDDSPAAAPYANHLIFLFMGGFLLAVAMQRWNLHRRIALKIIKIVGTNASKMILGFMIATGFLSMWISNTATTMMMTPIALSVVMQVADLAKRKGIDVEQGKFKFGTALMLCIAYSASIGGVGTIIGTPPNTVFVGVVNEMYGIDIGFAQWMMYGVPIAVIGIFFAWIYVTKFAVKIELDELPGGLKVIDKELKKLGRMTGPEKKVLVVFTLVALSWISRKFVISKFFPFVHDSTLAILGAVVLFLIPVDLKKGKFLLDWTTAVKIPWGIILLFGGGLSLASGFKSSGLAEWIGGQLGGLEGMPMFWIMFAVVTMTIFLTEVTSNTASTTMLMPIMAAMASAMSVHPYGMMVTAATAASFAFMLPVATPPNAVVFGSGYVTIPQMAKTGLGLNIFGIIIISLLAYFWLPITWGINLLQVPGWM